MKKVLVSLLLVLTLAACLDTSAAIQQPANPSPAPAATPTVTASTTPAPLQCTVTAGALHVRRGPGLSYAVIGYLYAGDIVTIETQRGAWYAIGADRWVHSKYCEE